MNKTLTVEQAVDLLLRSITAPDAFEEPKLPDALGRVLFETLCARIDQPPFDRSPLDGYAVRHEDIENADKTNPAVLKVAQRIFAGDSPQEPVRSGEAARIMTGAPIPPGATCVVRQEDTDYGKEYVKIYQKHEKHENFCFRGEDVSKGRPLVGRGERIDSARLGILAGHGYGRVKVFPLPKVGIISTGSELVTAQTPLSHGEIYDSNSFAISARASEAGARPVVVKSVPDDLDRLVPELENALSLCDLVVTTGGVSVGERDYMPEAGKRLGARELFHGISAKPGGPALALYRDGKLIICLSGNPFAAYATFELLAVPVIRRLAGETAALPKRVAATLMDEYDKFSHGRRFLRARIEGGNVFLPEGGHASGVLSSLAGCNCMIDIPAGTQRLKAGETVEAVLFAPNAPVNTIPADSPKAPPVIAIAGVKNSGKTTLISNMLPILSDMGLRVAVIKHDGHDFEPDVPGTDSYRVRKAGACGVAVFSAERYMVSEERPDACFETLTGRFNGMDLILLEGGKHSAYPKIEVSRRETGREPVCEASALIAFCTDTGRAPPGIPVFKPEQYREIAELIVKRIK